MDKEFSIPLPRSLDTRIYMRLIVKSTILVMQVTTRSADEHDTAVPMGSMVYALPDKFNGSVPLTTPIYREEPTIDFTTRLARFLVKKTQMPVYASSSLSLASTGLGGTAEEEMDAFKAVAEIAAEKLQQAKTPRNALLNGTSSTC